jgi:hypothetical protein
VEFTRKPKTNFLHRDDSTGQSKVTKNIIFAMLFLPLVGSRCVSFAQASHHALTKVSTLTPTASIAVLTLKSSLAALPPTASTASRPAFHSWHSPTGLAAQPTLSSSTFLDLRSLCMTLLRCRKTRPRTTSSATSRPFRYQPSSPSSASAVIACRRSPPCDRSPHVARLVACGKIAIGLERRCKPRLATTSSRHLRPSCVGRRNQCASSKVSRGFFRCYSSARQPMNFRHLSACLSACLCLRLSIDDLQHKHLSACLHTTLSIPPTSMNSSTSIGGLKHAP